jgi:hypothetical protein
LNGLGFRASRGGAEKGLIVAMLPLAICARFAGSLAAAKD